jgi:flavodoxin
MKILILYDSFFGNTEKVAEIFERSLSENHKTDIVKITSNEAFDPKVYDLLIIGSPTRAFSATKPIKEFIKNLESSTIQQTKFLVFETRMDANKVDNKIFTLLDKKIGSASQTIRKLILKKGGIVLKEPKSFFVDDSQGSLSDGENEKADRWVKEIDQIKL